MLAPTKLDEALDVIKPGDKIPFMAGVQFCGNLSNSSTASCTIPLGRKIDESVTSAAFSTCTAYVIASSEVKAKTVYHVTGTTSPYVTVSIADKGLGMLKAIFHYTGGALSSGVCMVMMYPPENGTVLCELEFS